MKWYNKVVWAGGTLLRSRLFQQQERYLENYAHKRTLPLSPFFWGFQNIEIDKESLFLGKILFSNISGIFPDGTPFDAPGYHALPAPLSIEIEHLGQRIYLALPIRMPNSVETIFEDDKRSLARYRVFDYELSDSNSIEHGQATVQLADLRLYLLPEKKLTSAWIGLPFAYITDIRADGSVVLDPYLIPPVNVYTASELLVKWLWDIHGLLRMRADSIAQRFSGGQYQGGVTADISEYLILQILNKNDPILLDLLEAKSASPHAVYQMLAAFAGELSTFIRFETRRPLVHPSYRHEELQKCIGPIIDDLRNMLNVVLERGAQLIPLKIGEDNMRIAILSNAQFERFGTFIIAVSAQLSSDILQEQFAAQVTIGPSERLPDLIRTHVSGIELQKLPVAPRQIPFSAASVYFEIRQDNPLWELVVRHGALALHVAGRFPELRIELWGIVK